MIAQRPVRVNKSWIGSNEMTVDVLMLLLAESFEISNLLQIAAAEKDRCVNSLVLPYRFWS